ncbi:hypothetical protein O1611_g10438 [Lasiodiplodia mahajangana]|uniref:Uncharacterized protein n=1 Tax=Lasiodiplodia mahajangana TaxID=1108764 RepID=A0ACC2IY85_9PEZI|nr:hypothetical protein O1611_g10438 [Lasiodiplodia mahajangana]
MRALSAAVVNPFRLLFSPHAGSADDPPKLDKILLPENVTLSGVGEQLPPVAWNADTTPIAVIDAALELLSRDMSNVTRTSAGVSIFCDNWQQALARGLFSGQAVNTILTGILDGLNAKPVGVLDSKACEKRKLLVIEATIKGMSGRGTGQATSFDYIAWNSILRGASKIQMNTIRIFTKAMTCVPEPHLISVSSGILENLNSFFRALGRATERSTLSRQASKMLVPLMNLGQPELRFILDDATQRLLEYAHADDLSFVNIRFGWLLFLARLPGMDKEYLARTCAALETGITRPPLPESEICHLFLAWINSQVPLRRYDYLLNTVNRNTKDCYFMLGSRLWRTRQFHHTIHFSKFLDSIDRENAIASLARGVSNPRRGGPCTLASIALGVRKPLAAIDILCLFEECRRRKKSFWNSAFGFKALEILTWLPGFDYRKILRLLNIDPSRQFRVQRRRHRLRRLHPAIVAKIVAKPAPSPILTGPHPPRHQASARWPTGNNHADEVCLVYNPATLRQRRGRTHSDSDRAAADVQLQAQVTILGRNGRPRPPQFSCT